MGLSCALVQLLPEEVERLRTEAAWHLERKVPDEQVLDLGKMWHCLHYLLTDSADDGTPPLDLFGLAVQQLRTGSDERNVLDPIQVRDLCRTLKSITHQTLRLRFDPNRMIELDIYWSDYIRNNPGSECNYLLTLFDDLKVFVSEASTRNMGLLVEAA
jgi:hypothetical protein